MFYITIATFIRNVLPNHERTSEIIALLKGLLSKFKLFCDYFLSYKEGADAFLSASLWTAGTYNQYEVLIHPETGAVYEVSVSSTSTDIGTSSDWALIQKNFIGVDESQHFYGGRMSLVYALNKQYATNYLTDPDVMLSDIYIEDVTKEDDMFQIGFTESMSSAIFSNTCTESITYNDTNVSAYSFIIRVPASRFPTFGALEDKMIRDFADQYITKGVVYLVEDY